MIRSMTAYGQGLVETEHGSINIEIRSVNNRYFDLNLRIPEDLRFAETRIREIAGKHAKRGKLELKVSYSLSTSHTKHPIDIDALQELASELALARKYIPDIQAPIWSEIPRVGNAKGLLESEIWLPVCEQACESAFKEFNENRQREGERLASAMLEMADECNTIVDKVSAQLPEIIKNYQEKVSQRLQEALNNTSPEGFSAISGEELSARIAQEASLFGLRVDVAEEITRQKSHIQELKGILAGTHESTKRNSSNGKRMDFLFQEMNREANTLGSKSAGLDITQAAIDLKLLIEQLREQAQNIE